MTILQLLGAGAGLLGATAAGAMTLLPRHIHIERSALISATPQDILTLAASNRGYQQFNPYKTADQHLKITPFGPDQGVGSGFHFDGKEGKGSQTVARVSENAIAYDIDLGAMGRPRQTISVQPVTEGTHVVWSIETDLGLNPLARIFGLFMDRMIGQTLAQGLRNLDQAT